MEQSYSYLDTIHSLMIRSREAVCYIDLKTEKIQMNLRMETILPELSCDDTRNLHTFFQYLQRTQADSHFSLTSIDQLRDDILYERLEEGNPLPFEFRIETKIYKVIPFLIDDPQVLFLVWQDQTCEIEMRTKRDLFMAELSHEFRTPLTSIKGFTTLLLQQPNIASKSLRMLSIIQQETERLERLVDHFLDFERLQACNVPLNRSLFQIAPFLEDILASFSSVASMHDLSINLTSSEISLFADQEKIRHCLQNLIHNAIKYSPDGGSISIEASNDGIHTLIVVRDQGIGIPSDSISKIFEPYYRVESDEHRRIKGTGLGLQICKRYIEEHDGTITVESEVGRGTSFSICLPL